jgi:hypothetical protein
VGVGRHSGSGHGDVEVLGLESGHSEKFFVLTASENAQQSPVFVQFVERDELASVVAQRYAVEEAHLGDTVRAGLYWFSRCRSRFLVRSTCFSQKAIQYESGVKYNSFIKFSVGQSASSAD